MTASDAILLANGLLGLAIRLIDYATREQTGDDAERLDALRRSLAEARDMIDRWRA